MEFKSIYLELEFIDLKFKIRINIFDIKVDIFVIGLDICEIRIDVFRMVIQLFWMAIYVFEAKSDKFMSDLLYFELNFLYLKSELTDVKLVVINEELKPTHLEYKFI